MPVLVTIPKGRRANLRGLAIGRGGMVREEAARQPVAAWDSAWHAWAHRRQWRRQCQGGGRFNQAGGLCSGLTLNPKQRTGSLKQRTGSLWHPNIIYSLPPATTFCFRANILFFKRRENDWLAVASARTSVQPPYAAAFTSHTVNTAVC